MISLESLKEHAKRKNFNLGQAEKDYFQEIILFILYREFGKELVFKGGTALTKCFGFDRFSEDLDFNIDQKRNITSLISSGLDAFYIDHDIEQKVYRNSLNITCRIQGPLYNGSRISMCKISLDLSIRQKTLLEPKLVKIGLLINEIPSFDVVVMEPSEIFAEKIRAIFTRNKARDMYDIYYLIKMGVAANLELINNKLSMYSVKFSIEKLNSKLSAKKGLWDTELKHLTGSYPSFSDAKKTITKCFRTGA